MTALGHPEVEDLLGAFALDALDPDEADAVDLHLRDCPRCRAEVADFREAAALLAFGGVEAPPGVWEKIQASLEEAPPQLELARVVPMRPASRWQTMGAKVAAAAAVVISVAALAISLTGVGPGSGSGSDRGEVASVADVVRNAAANPDGLSVHLAAARSGSTGAADIVILDGRAYLIRHSLPRLPAGASYDALAITAEKSPGVVASQNSAVVAGLVPVD
jgi:anti-sigma factor RsiW